MQPPPRDVAQTLTEIFQLERRADELRDAVLSAPPDVSLDALSQALANARAGGPGASRSVELVTIAGLLSRIRGARSVDLLIGVLGDADPDVRQAAGMALEGLAFERFREVADGIERAVKQLPPEDLALRELPYVLLEVPEQGVPKLLKMFLGHAHPEVVAAGIEAAVELGDPALADTIRALVKDVRTVELDLDESEGEDPTDAPSLATLGEMAAEALELLEAEGEGDEHGHPHDAHGHAHGPGACGCAHPHDHAPPSPNTGGGRRGHTR